jgi:N-carbamoylputrescine amidase
MKEGKQDVRSIRVAAVQMRTENGRRDDNLKKSSGLVERAAGDGAQLIVLPECASPGYVMDRRMWDWAEPLNGPTVDWLTRTSKRLGVYLGIGLVEADGEDFYNAYVLAGPDGKVAGRVRKRRTEFNIFRAGDSPSVIATPLGRIGFGICADFHYTDMPRLLHEKSVDLVLMPHAWTAPLRTSKIVTEADMHEATELVKGYAQFYARMLGVPVVFADQTGPLAGSVGGIWGKLMDPAVFGYPGFSTIADSDGTARAQMGEEEGIVVADVILDPSRKHFSPPKSYDGWLHPGAPLMRKVVLPAGIAGSKLSYALSGERKRRARQVSATSR